MSDNNKIFDDTYRQNFIANTDPIKLNDYLKNMERLSRKNNKYLEMYNKDIFFLVELNDQMSQNESTSLNLLPGYNNMMTEQECATDVYIGRFNNITQATITTVPKVPKAENELETIKNTLANPLDTLTENKKKAISRFIDIIMYCESVFIKEYDITKIEYINTLTKLIANTNSYMKEAFIYLTKILQTNKNKVSEEFMKSYIDLRTKKKLSDYKSLKKKLLTDYLNKLGQEKLYASKFVEKIIDRYKRSPKTT
ncbi:MAG: hypothetical protein Barrevirus5_4 [Barrevirus sp.]|uniref:Uncharacterized protein n=1 Tax=Barrevirus sp. TaxID=2487763 RepID=A0A3G4ZPY2_9VIRU|nr:MAG: hypothetical protein Barrevirus5_4 [Barrevirus sp.]